MSRLLNSLRSDNYGKIVEMLQKEYRMPETYAKEYINNLNYYVHGIASYVAVGFVDMSKQEITERVQRVNEALLRNWREMRPV